VTDAMVIVEGDASLDAAVARRPGTATYPVASMGLDIMELPCG
jgi:hypothetical protein